MEPKKIVKIVARLAVGSGTNTIINAIIRNNVEPENTRDKIAVAAGSLAVSAMVADAAKKYTDEKVEQAFELYEKLRNRNPDEPIIGIIIEEQ